MKKLILIFTIFLGLLGTVSAKSTTKKDTITVNGNCGECKARIEEAAYNVKGVKSANWNKKTHILTIVYNTSKADLDKITNAVANAGHDANGVKATDKIYKTLPACCAYRDGKCSHE